MVKLVTVLSTKDKRKAKDSYPLLLNIVLKIIANIISQIKEIILCRLERKKTTLFADDMIVNIKFQGINKKWIKDILGHEI